ncbi:MAG: hypothetical protein KGD61_07575 [Candidatus Lokiarchaeota archaeon]|nr:hypothetical protein [Candidatus Lokiarchaeota archaeon]
MFKYSEYFLFVNKEFQFSSRRRGFFSEYGEGSGRKEENKSETGSDSETDNKDDNEWDKIDWSEDNSGEQEDSIWNEIDWSENNSDEQEESIWNEIDWNMHETGEQEKNEEENPNDESDPEQFDPNENKENYQENISSDLTSTILISENKEELQEVDQEELEKEIEKELEEGVEAINKYLNNQCSNDLSEKTRVYRILNQFMRLLSQKYKNLTQRILIERSEVQLIYNILKNTGIPVERLQRILREHKDLDMEFNNNLNVILQEVENIKMISQKQIGDLIGCDFGWILKKKASISLMTLKRLELLANDKINSEVKIWRNEERRLVNPEEIRKVYLKLKNVGVSRTRLKKIIEENRELDELFSDKLEQLDEMKYKKFASRKEISELIDFDFKRILNPDKNYTVNLKTLKKLELLVNREIPHKIMIGQYEKLRIDETEKLVELVGIILGDGSISDSYGKYSLRIALNDKHEKEYVEYVKALMLKVFNVEPVLQPEKGATVLTIWRKSVVRFLISKGLKAGNKVENQVNVPYWAQKTQIFIIRCLKGLVDTDGWIGVEKTHKTIEIKFSNSSLPLITNFKEFCHSLGIRTGSISPSKRYSKKEKKMITEFSLGIHSKQHVKKFIETIKPMKWKYRYNIIGLTLIAIKNPAKWKRIKERLKIKYPDGRSHWNNEYENYLKNLCEEEGLKINPRIIKKAIDDAFEYKRRRS